MKQLFSAVAALIFSLTSVAAATVDVDQAATPTLIAALAGTSGAA